MATKETKKRYELVCDSCGKRKESDVYYAHGWYVLAKGLRNSKIFCTKRCLKRWINSNIITKTKFFGLDSFFGKDSDEA